MKCGDVKRAQPTRSTKHHRPRPFHIASTAIPHTNHGLLHILHLPPSLQPHDLSHLLVRRVLYCGKQASASEGERRLRQLRRDGEMRPCCCCCSCCHLRCGLSCIDLCVTRPLRRLPRTARALWRAGPCFVCGGAWARGIGGACGGFTDGLAG
jgi:hypothetical protein